MGINLGFHLFEGVEMTPIPARGLKPLVVAAVVVVPVVCRNDTNPRQGTETGGRRQQGKGAPKGVPCRNDTNPRQGTETSTCKWPSNDHRWVEMTPIPARGLKLVLDHTDY
jgi:hypothetical protein